LPSRNEDSSAEGDERTLGVPRPLMDRLPAFYRETPELLSPLVEVAEDLLAHLRESFAEARETVGRRSWGLGSRNSLEAAATREGVEIALADACGVRPRVWNGWTLEEHSAGGVVFRRASRSPAAVIAWEKSALDDRGLDPAERARRFVSILLHTQLPVSVEIAAVLLSRIPRDGRPRPGERIRGEVICRWPPQAVEGGA
jgi:hypothetical protein